MSEILKLQSRRTHEKINPPHTTSHAQHSPGAPSNITHARTHAHSSSSVSRAGGLDARPYTVPPAPQRSHSDHYLHAYRGLFLFSFNQQTSCYVRRNAEQPLYQVPEPVPEWSWWPGPCCCCCCCSWVLMLGYYHHNCVVT